MGLDPVSEEVPRVPRDLPSWTPGSKYLEVGSRKAKLTKQSTICDPGSKHWFNVAGEITVFFKGRRASC